MLSSATVYPNAKHWDLQIISDFLGLLVDNESRTTAAQPWYQDESLRDAFALRAFLHPAAREQRGGFLRGAG